VRRFTSAQARSRSAAVVAAAAVLTLGLLGTGAAAREVSAAGQRAQGVGADRYADQASAAVEAEMRRYQDTVEAVAASLSAQNDLRAADFDAVTRPLADARLAGASGVAFVVPATTRDVPAVQRFWQRQGARGLRLQPDPASTEHELVIFHRPLDGQSSLAGVDVAPSPQLRGVLARSTTRSGVTLSDSYILLKDRSRPLAQQQLSFVLAAPVAAAPGSPATAGPRGWLAMGLRGQDLLRHTLREATQGQANATLTAIEGGAQNPVVAQLVSGPAHDERLVRIMSMPVADRQWTLRTQSTDRAAHRDGGGDQAFLLLAGGAGLSGLLAAVIYLVMTARRRALVAVDAATADLQAAERSAARQAALLGAVMDSISDGVGAVDGTGAFILHNPAAKKLLGIEEDVDDPAAWQEHYGLYRPDGVEPFPTDELPLVRALRGNAPSHVEMVIRHRGRPEPVPISVSARPLDPKAGLTGAVAVFHDLTATKDFQRRLADHVHQLEEANADLREANSELEAFSHTVSHDLRAPLRAIGAFSSLLLKDHAVDLGPEARHYLGRICENAVEMNALIQDLLAFSRVLRAPLNKLPTPLAECAQTAWAEVLEGQGTAAQDWAGRLHVDELPTVPADPRLMKQVFVNLLSNAAKFCAPGRPLEITVETGADPAGTAEPALTVRDNGIGFEPEHAARIFGVFQRLHKAGDYEGTGIGLSIVERIVARHGGRTWAEGRPGEGAAFSFTLGPDSRPGTRPDTDLDGSRDRAVDALPTPRAETPGAEGSPPAPARHRAGA
jgi:signal transduction histidine kinase/CHASE1-domain containing sensor protein